LTENTSIPVKEAPFRGFLPSEYAVLHGVVIILLQETLQAVVVLFALREQHNSYRKAPVAHLSK